MLRIRKFPRILVSFYIIGYIFAFFALFYRTKWVFASITFASSALLNYLYFISDGYRSSKFMIRAKKLIDKGRLEEAVDSILQAARIAEDEEVLVQINSIPKKNIENYGKTAQLLTQRFKELDTPFIRFVTASFFFTVHDLEKTKDILIDIPTSSLTIKMGRLLGSVLYELGDYQRAIRVFSSFNTPKIPQTEDQLALVYGLAICHIGKGETKKAIEFLQRVKAKSPAFGNADKLLKDLESQEEQEKS